MVHPVVGLVEDDRQPVIGHGDLDEFNATLGAGVDFLGLDGTGGIRDVGLTGCESLEATAGS